MSYVEPNKDKAKFHCPHCAKLTTTHAVVGHKHLHTTNPKDEILKAVSVRVCDSCGQPIIWLHDKMIHPKRARKPAPPRQEVRSQEDSNRRSSSKGRNRSHEQSSRFTRTEDKTEQSD